MITVIRYHSRKGIVPGADRFKSWIGSQRPIKLASGKVGGPPVRADQTGSDPSLGQTSTPILVIPAPGPDPAG